MNGEIFHILEVDVPLGDGTFKRFWYGSVSSDDGIIKMSRIEDLKSWEYFINKRSQEVLTKTPKLNVDNDVVSINMGPLKNDYNLNRKKPFIFIYK